MIDENAQVKVDKAYLLAEVKRLLGCVPQRTEEQEKDFKDMRRLQDAATIQPVANILEGLPMPYSVDELTKKYRSIKRAENAALREAKRQHKKKLIESGFPLAVITLPSGGRYEIWHTREALETLLPRVKQIDKIPVDMRRPSLRVSKPHTIKVAKERPTTHADQIKAIGYALSTNRLSRTQLLQPYYNADTGEIVATDGKQLAVILTKIGVKPWAKGQPEIGVPGGWPDYTKVIDGYTPRYLPDQKGAFVASDLCPVSLYEQVCRATISSNTDRKGKDTQQIVEVSFSEGQAFISAAYDSRDAEAMIAADKGRVEIKHSAKSEKTTHAALLDATYLKNALRFLAQMGNERVTYMRQGTNGLLVMFIGSQEYAGVARVREAIR